MDLMALNFNEEIEQSILSLSIKVELRERKRIRAIKSLENLVLLLKIAEKSRARDVIEALVNFVHQLDSKQLSFFNTLGIDLLEDNHHNIVNHISYRGAHVSEEQNHTKDMHIHHGKKRIVYRGCESWV